MATRKFVTRCNRRMISDSLLYHKASPECCNSAHAASPCPRLLDTVLSPSSSPLLFFAFSAGYVKYRLPKDRPLILAPLTRVWIICGAGSVYGNTGCSQSAAISSHLSRESLLAFDSRSLHQGPRAVFVCELLRMPMGLYK